MFSQQDLNASSSALQSWLLQSSGQPPRTKRDPEPSSSALAPSQPSLRAC